MRDWNFENPEMLWLLLLLPLLAAGIWWRWRREKAGIVISSASGLFGVRGWRVYMLPLLAILRLLAVGSIVIALARPRTTEVSAQSSETKGVDIILAVDVSGSMLARDFDPNRLEATKRVADEFVRGRPADRFGLVLYAGEAYTQVPLTGDKRVMREALEDIEYGLLEDGTAIGMGLGTAVNRLKKSRAESKVIVLMTDGVNNRGSIDPKTAARLAKEHGIRAYTIGIGSRGEAPFPVQKDARGKLIYRNMPVEIDEDLMKEIAAMTEGKYFRATDEDKLEAIYEEIDQLEKTELEELKFYKHDEKYAILVWIAGGILLFELLVRNTLLKSVA